MSSIDALAAELLADPKPVLFLDTCDILNVMQCLAEPTKNSKGNPSKEKKPGPLEWTTRLLSALSSEPVRVKPVVCYLVAHEWSQNLPTIQEKVDVFLADVDSRIAHIYSVLTSIELQPPSIPSAAFSFAQASPPLNDPISRDLIARMQAIFANSGDLDADDSCTQRALSRVMEKRRPSHAGQIKDSIILEHYLALVGRLRSGHFQARCVFVSSNTKDYAESAKSPALHPDLVNEFALLNLEYFSNPVEAMARLGL